MRRIGVSLAIVLACVTTAFAQNIDQELERQVYSFLITDEHVPGTMPNSTNYFIVTCAVQTDVTARQLKAKFGEPAVIEPNVKYDTLRKGNMAPEFHQGDLWFYGRVGVLIENNKAVIVVRRARREGTGTESLRRSMIEAMNIGLAPKQ